MFAVMFGVLSFSAEDYQQQAVQEARVIFAEYDKDGNSLISELEVLGHNCSDQQADCVGDWLGAFDTQYDSDNDGGITFRELVSSVFNKLADAWYSPHRLAPELFSPEVLPDTWFDPAMLSALHRVRNGKASAAEAFLPLIHEEAAGWAWQGRAGRGWTGSVTGFKYTPAGV